MRSQRFNQRAQSMPLPPPPVALLSYRQLVREALERVPSHTPEWTNLNDADPGVTIVQLFAFLTETLSYRADLVPERNRLKFLQLLDVPLMAAQPARGLVAFANPRGAAGRHGAAGRDRGAGRAGAVPHRDRTDAAADRRAPLSEGAAGLRARRRSRKAVSASLRRPHPVGRAAGLLRDPPLRSAGHRRDPARPGPGGGDHRRRAVAGAAGAGARRARRGARGAGQQGVDAGGAARRPAEHARDPAAARRGHRTGGQPRLPHAAPRRRRRGLRPARSAAQRRPRAQPGHRRTAAARRGSPDLDRRHGSARARHRRSAAVARRDRGRRAADHVDPRPRARGRSAVVRPLGQRRRGDPARLGPGREPAARHRRAASARRGRQQAGAARDGGAGGERRDLAARRRPVCRRLGDPVIGAAPGGSAHAVHRDRVVEGLHAGR